MTAFQRTIICMSLGIGFLWFYKGHRPDMTIVYPDNCVFVIDRLFSRSMQLEIKDFIDASYKKSKNPSNLLPKIESHFPAIKSVVIDMQNPDALNFSIQKYQPMFLINDEHVICQHEKMFNKEVFAQDELTKLENISFDGVPTPKHVERLTRFFLSLTQASHEATPGKLAETGAILKDFSVRWVDKHAIWLDQKQDKGQDLSLLVGYDTVPTMQDVAQCRDLRGQIPDKPCKDKRGRPLKNNTTWVCDLRFDQQIVLFSTNKGV